MFDVMFHDALMMQKKEKEFVKDGETVQYYQLMLQDGIYPVPFTCTHEVFDAVEDGKRYDFIANLSVYRGKTKTKLVKARRL